MSCWCFIYEYLKENNLNYSVQDLIIRYSLAGTKIFEYYVGNLDTGEFLPDVTLGELKYTKDDVKKFYDSSECVRVIMASLPSLNFSKERAEQIRNTIIEKAKYGEESVAYYVIGLSTTGGSDIKAGEIIGRHNLESAYYSELVNAAFALKSFEVSDVIEVVTGVGVYYHILYKTIKSDSNFEENYDNVRAAYLENEVGKILDSAAITLKEAFKNTDVLNAMDYSEIKMD